MVKCSIKLISTYLNFIKENHSALTFSNYTLLRYLYPMFVHRVTHRIRYAETDQMGYMYYGRYPELFEIGRVEAFRSLGVSYKQLEEEGYLMPVLQLGIKYYKPLFYDDLITIETTIPVLPSVKIPFTYKIFNSSDVLCTEGDTTLVFITKQLAKPVPMPTQIVEALKLFF